MKLKFRSFKGLYTNIDASDKPAEYFSKFKDIKVYPGYIESKGLSFTEEAYGLPAGHTFVRQQYVFLDEDKYQNTVNGTITNSELEFVLNTGYRTDISFRGTPTTTEAHSYKIRISGIYSVPAPSTITKCFTFKWSKDNGEESEAIPVIPDGETNYTQDWYPLIDGLEIQFHEYMYNPIPTDKVWLIRSDWTTPIINEDPLTLTNNYVQNIQKYLFQISYKDGYYHFYIDRIEVFNSPFADVANQYPKIVNEQGTLKVLMKKQALWIGKINRSIWDKDEIYTYPKGFYLENLIDTFEDTELPFDLIPVTSIPPNNLPVTSRIINDRDAVVYFEGLAFKATRVTFYDGEEQIDIYNWLEGSNKAMVALMLDRFTYKNTPDGGVRAEGNFYCIPVHVYDNLLYTNGNIDFQWHTDLGNFPDRVSNWAYRGEVANDGWDNLGFLLEDGTRSGHYLAHDQYYIFGETYFKQIFNIDNTIIINANATVFDSEKTFGTNFRVDVAITSIVDGMETVRTYKRLSTPSSPYILQVVPKADLQAYRPYRKAGYVIYLRLADLTEEDPENDFEQAYNYILTETPEPSIYLDKLSPNGIMLTQTIGKYFDPLTYKIIDSFDDYSNVAGVPYILKNSNVHYPAVGGGSILNNFYYENVVPGIEGQRLIAFANLLGVFSSQKELMTLIDFSPVESSMIFYIKDTLGYKIRDEKDIAESTEGTFIHLREGIYVTNGRERTLISEPINDLVRKYYKNANIFYNTYWKQLYYYNGNDLYCFDFETQSWSQYTLPRGFDKGELKDFIEDFEGGIFFIASRESYKLEYIAKTGELELSYIDLQEYSISKRINYLVADHSGTIEATDIAKNEVNNARGIRYLFNKLDNRKPIKDIVVGIKFNGILYGIEMDIETMRTEQL